MLQHYNYVNLLIRLIPTPFSVSLYIYAAVPLCQHCFYVVTTYFNRHTGKLSLRRYYVASSFTIMYETTHIERHPSSLSYFRIHGERVSELLLLGEESLSPAQSPTHQCHTHDMRSLVTEGIFSAPLRMTSKSPINLLNCTNLL